MEVTSQGSPLLQGTVSRNAVTLGQDGWVYAGKTAYEGGRGLITAVFSHG